MAKAESFPFKNSSTCEGVAHVSNDAPLDLSTIAITGRYPEQGQWAKNEVVHEMVYVQRGMGSLAIRSGGVTELQAGDAIDVPPNTWFAWNGYMDIIMACSPPFNPEQYSVQSEASIEEKEQQL